MIAEKSFKRDQNELLSFYGLKQLIGTTKIPSCRLYSAPEAVKIIMKEGAFSSLFSEINLVMPPYTHRMF